MAFLTQEQVAQKGFQFVGKEVKIFENAVFSNCLKISINDYSRIDDFCLISAKKEGIIIGKCVHVAAYYSMQRAGKFVLEDFSGLSSRVAVYSSSDDYCGQVMTNPSVPQRYENLHSGPVTLRKYVIIDVNSCILPNVEIGYGLAIGAFSLLSENIGDFTNAVGLPAKPKLYRKQNFVELEKQFLNSDSNQK